MFGPTNEENKWTSPKTLILLHTNTCACYPALEQKRALGLADSLPHKPIKKGGAESGMETKSTMAPVAYPR